MPLPGTLQYNNNHSQENLCKWPQKISFFLKAISLVWILLILLSCTSIDLRNGIDFGMKGLANGDPMLAFTALVTEYVSDPYARTFLYTRLADEYEKRAQVKEALTVIRRGERVSRTETTDKRYQVQIALAAYYTNYQQFDHAHDLLKEALNQVLAIEREDQRGQALESIILLCFKVRDVFNDILRVAIDNVYALYDPEFRVQLLTDLGQKYQEQNAGNRASVFIQQSLAAASGITNPWARSLAYAEIGSRFLNEDVQAKGRQYLDLAVSEMETVEILSLGTVDAQNILKTVIVLADNGRFSDATSAISRFPDFDQRVNATLAIVERYVKQKNLLPARLLVQRLLNQLAGEDPESEKELSLSTLVRLAEIYVSGDSPDEALRYTQAALTYLSSPLITNNSEYRSRLSLIMAKAGHWDEAIACAGLIVDAYVAGQTLRQLAPIHNQTSLLQEAEIQARQATYLKETLMSAVGVTAWQMGERSQALGLFAELEDPFTLASSLLDAISKPIEASNKPLDEKADTSLRDIARAWYKRPITR